MTPLTAYLALALYPLVRFLGLLLLNPVAFYWGFTKGKEPMPPPVLERAESVSRCMLFIIDAILLAGIFYFIRRHSISFTHFGFPLDGWLTAALVGCSIGAAWEGFRRQLMAQFQPAVGEPGNHWVLRGNRGLWVLLFITGSFSEESWRALCLVLLMMAGHSAAFAVVVSSLVFGITHLRQGFGGVLNAALVGVGLALLFLWFGTLIAPFAAHFTANTIHMYWMRRVSAESTQ
ncbi:CPBP family intramembrane metalloprotease [Candidatus Bathyarchaeota archaeon]|nr:CPBP family intramembrane metalloprotease [Candidatus Bathyarchaeota archaeon]